MFSLSQLFFKLYTFLHLLIRIPTRFADSNNFPGSEFRSHMHPYQIFYHISSGIWNPVKFYFWSRSLSSFKAIRASQGYISYISILFPLFEFFPLYRNFFPQQSPPPPPHHHSILHNIYPWSHGSWFLSNL